MYGNITIYGGGRRGRGGRGGDRGRGGDHGRGGAVKKFSGKCDLCHQKGHKIIGCPKFISIVAIAEAATARADGPDAVGESVAGGETEAGGETVDGGEKVTGGESVDGGESVSVDESVDGGEVAG